LFNPFQSNKTRSEILSKATRPAAMALHLVLLPTQFRRVTKSLLATTRTTLTATTPITATPSIRPRLKTHPCLHLTWRQSTTPCRQTKKPKSRKKRASKHLTITDSAPLRLANEAGGKYNTATALIDRCLDQVYHGVRGVGADGLLALAWLGY